VFDYWLLIFGPPHEKIDPIFKIQYLSYQSPNFVLVFLSIIFVCLQFLYIVKPQVVSLFGCLELIYTFYQLMSSKNPKKWKKYEKILYKNFDHHDYDFFMIKTETW